MSLLQDWRDIAYAISRRTRENCRSSGRIISCWKKGIYEQLLTNPDEVVKGTVKELAEKYNISVMNMVGFLDGINDSLKIPNPIEEMDENTEVNLAFDKELLY